MDFEITIQRLSQIADILKQMSWETLGKHSPDDLEADYYDVEEIIAKSHAVLNALRNGGDVK
jgi:hypothetical protein